jgi:parallel beta-helix repeat protein
MHNNNVDNSGIANKGNEAKSMIYKRILFLSLVFLLMSTIMCLHAKATPAVIRVPEDYPKIQDAIDNANPEDTVQVSIGTYFENLFINKTLKLIGENKDTTFLDGNGGQTVVLVNSTSVAISGFTIRNGSDGIILEGCSGSTIEGNDINCFSTGIWLHYSDSNVVSDNLMLNSGYCGLILCGGSSENNVTHNTLRNNVNAMIMTGTNNLIYHNNFINNQNQTWMKASLKNAWNNTCDGNYWSDYNGTEFDRYGIGSTPYVIDANNQDNYPLKTPYLLGDINHDAKVSILDISIIARAFGTKPEDTRWNPHADIDENNEINIVDISKAAKNYGKEWKNP